MRNIDRARWQSDAYIEANYEPEPPTEPRGRVSPEIEDAVRRAYEAARDARRGRCGA